MSKPLVPLMLTAPGLVIAIAGPCTGWLADKFGRRKLLLSATLLYGICGTMPLYITSLTGIFLQPPRRRTGGGGSADHR
ncbi:MFS transporter [Klebsiella variicola subsp. variicola]|nr:MFS transporter [Klebsiella variicola subsp. variicola]